MKHEWKKSEKKFYLPKNRPEIIVIPKFKFLSIKGRGNPNASFFSEYIGVLYSLSYAVKMSSRTGPFIDHYYDYTVYPLEGVWDIDEISKAKGIKSFDKNSLVFNIMIRQPEFVSEEFANEIKERIKVKKPHELLDAVKFEILEEGTCVQMLHQGSYDDEPESFSQMESFAKEQNLRRKYHNHREIYLSDARKTVPEKLKTVLRFQVE
ncbi:MAG: GyrI-like domain-containing protein [Bacteroidetes bacterium]|nr:GyrI-like domain-containing protein [Bacteroidota bacterium]